jgi:hypothetical protein
MNVRARGRLWALAASGLPLICLLSLLAGCGTVTIGGGSATSVALDLVIDSHGTNGAITIAADPASSFQNSCHIIPHPAPHMFGASNGGSGSVEGAWRIDLSPIGAGSASGGTAHIYIGDPRKQEALPTNTDPQFSNTTPSHVRWSLVLPVSGASILNGGTVQTVEIFTPNDVTHAAYTATLAKCTQLPTPTPTTPPIATPTNTSVPQVG